MTTKSHNPNEIVKFTIEKMNVANRTAQFASKEGTDQELFFPGTTNLTFLYVSGLGVRMTTVFAAFANGTNEFLAAETLHDGIFLAGQETGGVLVEQTYGTCKTN